MDAVQTPMIVFDFIKRTVTVPQVPLRAAPPQPAVAVTAVSQGGTPGRVIPCKFVEGVDGLGTIIGAGIDTLTVQSLPSPIQFPLAVRLIGLPDGADHSLRLTILTPGMEQAIEPMEMSSHTSVTWIPDFVSVTQWNAHSGAADLHLRETPSSFNTPSY
jgi:hypothetical protein